MKILSIDTSCDDTCVALLEVNNRKVKILSNVVSSQVKIHRKYGGVYPMLAKREHQRNLPFVFKKAVQRRDFDLIGITVGPGLEPCLWQGINFAKELAEKNKKPLIPVNHIEAHILANFVGKSQITNSKSQIFPAVCLVVSGGHTGLFLMEKIGKYELIGETQDDAAGECFDKTARILGLSYPGGPAIAQQAARKSEIRSTKFEIRLPRPMIHQKNYDFSFSGLKTAVLYNYKSQSPEIKRNKEYIRAMSFEIQQAIIDVLLHKTLKAAKDFRAKSIILGGGVAANDELRQQFSDKLSVMDYKLNFFVPEKIYCTDNAVMIGVAAFFNRADKAKDLKSVKARGNLAI